MRKHYQVKGAYPRRVVNTMAYAKYDACENIIRNRRAKHGDILHVRQVYNEEVGPWEEYTVVGDLAIASVGGKFTAP